MSKENPSEEKADDQEVDCCELLSQNSLMKHMLDRAEDLIGDMLDCMTPPDVQIKISKWHQDKHNNVDNSG